MGHEQGIRPPVGAPGRARVIALLVAATGFLCGASATLDMDFHWHLALGQEIAARGFPDAEPFSHLPVGAPDRQAWLSDAAFAVLDRIGGVGAIRVVLGIAFAAGCLAVLRLARRRTDSTALALVPVAVYVALAMARLRVRPDLFTIALLPLFALLLDRPPSWRRVVDLLVVSTLWANLHPGSLIAGLLALSQLWPLTPLRIANAAATVDGLCLTPDGIQGLLRFTADTAPLRPLIPEWQRLWERPLAEFAPEWAVVVGVTALAAVPLVAALRARRLRPGPPASAGSTHPGPLRAESDHLEPSILEAGGPVREALRAVLGLLLAASAVRFLFALVLPALWAVSVLPAAARMRPAWRALAAAAVVAVFVFFPGAHLRDVARGVRAAGWSYLGADPPAFPLEAADWLAASKLSGNLAHPAGWGGYLAWKLAPRFRTATDGRVTHFGPELAREWSEGIDSPAREEIFARRGIDLVVIPRPMLPRFRDEEPYAPIYGDSFAIVLLRLDGPRAAENRAILFEVLKQRALPK